MLACREHRHAASVQALIASDLAALEAIWGVYLRNNITQLGAIWKVVLREKCSCLCCLWIVLCSLHEMGKFEGKVFSSVELGSMKISLDGSGESSLVRVLKPARSYWPKVRAKTRGIVTCL